LPKKDGDPLFNPILIEYKYDIISWKGKTLPETQYPISSHDLETIVFKTIREFMIELHPGNLLPPISKECRLSEHLKIDSLSKFQLIARLESKVGFHLSESLIFMAETIEELIEFIESINTSRNKNQDPGRIKWVPSDP
jgi:acyl carrier protein